MRKADQFEMVGEVGKPDRHAKMVGSVWEMTPRRQVWIGAADMDALAEIWEEITGTRLDRLVAQHLKVYASTPTESPASEGA